VSGKLEAFSALICHAVATVLEIQDILRLRGTIWRTDCCPLAAIMSRKGNVPADEELADQGKKVMGVLENVFVLDNFDAGICCGPM
jgi:hypothetical protein